MQHLETQQFKDLTFSILFLGSGTYELVDLIQIDFENLRNLQLYLNVNGMAPLTRIGSDSLGILGVSSCFPNQGKF